MVLQPVYSRFLAFSTLLLSFSCEKDPEPILPICRLTKTTIGNVSTKIEYNSDGFAFKVTGAYAVTGQEHVVEIEYVDDRLLKVNNSPNSFDEFSYEEGRLKEIRAMRKYPGAQSFSLAYTTTFEYDPAGEIVKAVYTGPGLPVYGALYERAVKSNGNTDRVLTTDNGTASGYGPERLKSEVIRFDDKINAHRTFPFIVNFMFGPGFLGISISYDHFQDSNNPLERKSYSSSGTTSEYVVSMEYNEHGYPVKSTSSGAVADLEYTCEQ
jgi:hypothetical protein